MQADGGHSNQSSRQRTCRHARACSIDAAIPTIRSALSLQLPASKRSPDERRYSALPHATPASPFDALWACGQLCARSRFFFQPTSKNKIKSKGSSGCASELPAPAEGSWQVHFHVCLLSHRACAGLLPLPDLLHPSLASAPCLLPFAAPSCHQRAPLTLGCSLLMRQSCRTSSAAHRSLHSLHCSASLLQLQLHERRHSD